MSSGHATEHAIDDPGFAMASIADAERLRPVKSWRQAAAEIRRSRHVLGGSWKTGSARIMRSLGVRASLRWRAAVAFAIVWCAMAGIYVAAIVIPFWAGCAATVVLLLIVGSMWSWSRQVVLSTEAGVALRLAPGGGFLGWRRYRTLELTGLVPSAPRTRRISRGSRRSSSRRTDRHAAPDGPGPRMG